MKLRNKKTGEIVELCGINLINGRAFVRFDDEKGTFKFEAHSLAELNAEWEDYEEPKEERWYWCVDYITCGVDHLMYDPDDPDQDWFNESIGNYFETEEEAKKAVEKLKAWKRLKDKGFVFKGINENDGSIKTGLSKGVKICDSVEFYEDMSLLFGGEE